MHPYIPHLLADIITAHRNEDEIAEAASNPQSMEEYFAAVDRWMAGEEPPHTFGYYCGLESCNFPPPGQLTGKDMKQVCKAFVSLLFSWDADIDLPDKLPVSLRYQFMINTLNEKFSLVNMGSPTFSYCQYYAPDCVFKEYCTCLEFWDDLDDDMSTDLSEGELPF